jgi:HSP20 family protein
MKNLPTQWQPSRQLSRFDPLAGIDELFRGLVPRGLANDYERALDMRMDVCEDEKAYKVTVDMPGIKKEAIDVSVEGNQVSISAECSRDKGGDNERELYSERFSGKAYRSFSLPSEVDSGAAKAQYDGGVLTLTLPKKPGTESRRLPVH